MAIYGFARLVDDIGDESSGDRLALLDWLEAELDRLYARGPLEHAVMRALAPTVVECGLPDAAFRRLIEANRRDQTVTRYETFDELLGYCQLSAAPVGELVLHVFGAATPDRVGLSDRICAGLQVTEHLQDVAEDYQRGRIYLPRQDMEHFGCQEADLAPGARSDAVRALMAYETVRARSLLAEGVRLARTLALRPRLAVAGFVAGGRAALGSLERSRFELDGRHGSRSKPAFAAGWLKAVSGR
jgi:squalene synthase HpnC